MADPITPQQVICEAAELIETKGWTTKTEHRPGIGYCLKGGCVAAANAHHLPVIERDLLLDLVVIYLAAAITGKVATGATWSTVTGYNDEKGRTKDQVLETARRAGRCTTT